MSTSGAAIVTVLRPVPFPKGMSSNYTATPTTYPYTGILALVFNQVTQYFWYDPQIFRKIFQETQFSYMCTQAASPWNLQMRVGTPGRKGGIDGILFKWRVYNHDIWGLTSFTLLKSVSPRPMHTYPKSMYASNHQISGNNCFQPTHQCNICFKLVWDSVYKGYIIR